ncbi:MAG TPA: FMN-dependent NADH-azoreductase [Burkholderiaceae bacterium]|nr:FMN-dependent NADH-azoreductase [Burkholderiaceae bacterium]
MKLLHLDSSILGDASVSRQLTAAIVQTYRVIEPDLEVTYRDLGAQPLEHLSGAALGQPNAQNETLIDELKAADVLVIGAPMYNFTIPSGLKAWIDRVSVAGKTFRYTEKGPQGLVPDKRTYIVASSGGQYSNTPIATMHVGYLQTLLEFLGIRDIKVIRAEGLALPGARDKVLAAAHAEVEALDVAAMA